MKYDFDEIVKRENTGCLKWDLKPGMLPLWVADMDFKSFPGIVEAMKARAEHGVFGYSIERNEWNEAYMFWWKKRHNFEVKKDWLVYVSGVIPALSSSVRKLTTPGENVLIQTPVYPMFFNSILNNGRNVLQNKLVYNEEAGSYSIDWDDLEKKLKDPQTSLMFFCNPQNPSGNIWDKETIIRIGELCYENSVTVIADEIHCDIVAPGREYIPFASVSDINKEISVTCISPSKTFNIAGIQSGAMVIPDKHLRHKMWRGVNTDEVGESNCFAIDAVKAAYTDEGATWVDELRTYLWDNRKYAEDYIKENIPELKTIPSDASYLMWVDCSKVTDDSKKLVARLERDQKLMVNAGADFGGNGDTFIRINLACPRKLLENGMERLKKGVRI